MCKTATFHGSFSMRQAVGDTATILDTAYRRRTHANEHFAEGRGAKLPGRKLSRRTRNGEEIND